MSSNIIGFKFLDFLKATLIIEDNGTNRVVVRFIPYGDEHYTLHLVKDKKILLTHYSSNKPKSTWDDLIVSAAKANKYKNPERHKNYIQHSLINSNDRYIGSRKINFFDFNPKQKYQNNINQTYEVNDYSFMLVTVLNSKNNKNDKKVVTSLGTISFEIRYGV